MGTLSSDPPPGDDEYMAELGLPIPIRDGDLFKHEASAYILNVLADNPEIDLSIRQLATVTPVSERATGEAVDVLERNRLVEVFHQGNARRVRINRARYSQSTDPIEQIPQQTFRTPVRVALGYIDDELNDVLGVILFGSVAQGIADRQSDIDMWILVDGESADLLEQRAAANKLARQLESLQIPTSFGLNKPSKLGFAEQWPEIRRQLEDETSGWPTAERYTYEFIIETPQSIIQQSSRVEPDQLFAQGITIIGSETLQRVKQEVLSNE